MSPKTSPQRLQQAFFEEALAIFTKGQDTHSAKKLQLVKETAEVMNGRDTDGSDHDKFLKSADPIYWGLVARWGPIVQLEVRSCCLSNVLLALEQHHYTISSN